MRLFERPLLRRGWRAGDKGVRVSQSFWSGETPHPNNRDVGSALVESQARAPVLIVPACVPSARAPRVKANFVH